MTKEDSKYIANERSKIPTFDSKARYVWINEAGVLRVGNLGLDNIGDGHSFKSTDLLRPVATIKIKNS